MTDSEGQGTLELNCECKSAKGASGFLGAHAYAYGCFGSQLSTQPLTQTLRLRKRKIKRYLDLDRGLEGVESVSILRERCGLEAGERPDWGRACWQGIGVCSSTFPFVHFARLPPSLGVGVLCSNVAMYVHT